MQPQGEKANGRTQTLKIVNGYPIVDNIDAGGSAPPPAEPLADTFDASELQPAPAATATGHQPSWVEYDRKVLRFYAFFKEAVNESRQENYRIRKCIIYYYLEDSSIHVAEPRQENSGIPQGVFIKRHKIPKSGGYVQWSDLVGVETVEFYGRVLYLVGADPFTVRFLEAHGAPVPETKAYPQEPIAAYRESLKKVKSGGPPKPRHDDLTRYMEAKLGRASNVLEPDKLHQFLENDRKVLRFFCVHDDRSRLYGDRRPYVLHYFLADDTVAILEAYEPNSGRDPFPVMLKKSKLPKGAVSMDMTLNPGKQEYVKATDLGIGKVINVYNRQFLLYDCDEFTRKWYGMEKNFRSVDIIEPQEPPPPFELPAYNGFGSLEDTTQNCISLIPKPVKKDFHKLMNNEKKILRFITKLVEGDRGDQLSFADKDRTFILSYFLADDTIAIFEPPARNSGIIGGKFLERCSVRKPAAGKEVGSPYTEADLYVGAVLQIHNRFFQLMEADEYTLRYMEDNKETFIYSDAGRILQELKDVLKTKTDAVRQVFIDLDKDGSGFLTADELLEGFRGVEIPLNKQQLVTVVRKLDSDGNGKVNGEEFLENFGGNMNDLVPDDEGK